MGWVRKFTNIGESSRVDAVLVKIKNCLLFFTLYTILNMFMWFKIIIIELLSLNYGVFIVACIQETNLKALRHSIHHGWSIGWVGSGLESRGY